MEKAPEQRHERIEDKFKDFDCTEPLPPMLNLLRSEFDDETGMKNEGISGKRYKGNEYIPGAYPPVLDCHHFDWD